MNIDPTAIIVSVITGVFALGLKLLDIRSRKPTKSPAKPVNHNNCAPLTQSSTNVNTSARLNLPASTESTHPNVQRTETQLQKIANSITDTPPFSREHVMRQYQGREVDWVLELYHLDQRGEELEATMHTGISTIFCRITTGGDLLKTAHERDLFRVRGRIENLVTKQVIHLADCTIEPFQD